MPRKYDLEFKLEAVRMAAEPGVTNREVERRLGIGQGVLSRWKRELKDDDAQAFPNKGGLKPKDEEMRRLKRENERLRRELDNQRLDAEIREIDDDSKGRYGSPKITEELRDRGRKVGKNRVAKRMRKAGLRSKIRRKYKVTTDSKHNFPVAPNLLERDFSAPAPDKVWVSDITYLATKTGWLYLTVIIDVFSRIVVGWALSSSLSHEMVVVALKRAVRRRRPAKGLIFHSDRGVQYACNDFRKELDKHEFIQSMSRKGDCWDNAVAESFFSIMKTELVYHERYEGHQDTLHSIFEYIEVFYNRQRRHSTLEYLCPAEYEKQQLKLCA